MSILSKDMQEKLEEVCFNSLTDGARKIIVQMIEAGETPTYIEKMVEARLQAMGIIGFNQSKEKSKWYLAAKHALRVFKGTPKGALSSDVENTCHNAV